MPMEIVKRGAEAVIRREGGALVKDRISKGYRLRELDEEIRRLRTRSEARLLERARRSGILTPAVSAVGKYSITMEEVRGERLKDRLDSMAARKQKAVAVKIGEMVAMLHSADIIHGDLTTSNMILKDDGIYLIDFGLGKVSHKVEDKATDLFLLWEALISAHYGISGPVWKNIINTYIQKYSTAADVMARFEGVSKRRRYK
ncbi:MAG: KEOPS complex kinase/ATPase Bud32 [Candidatus Aenigmatarchaeota archaeon]